MRLFIGAIAATLLLCQAALGWNPSDGNQAAVSEPEQNTAQAQQAKIERTLKGAGFTDIQMTPGYFFVRARSPDGNPITMIVDPSSMTAVIESPQSTPDEDSTTGSANPNQDSIPELR